MTRSVGRAVEKDGQYDWDGMKRGTSEFAVLQVTLTGSGLVDHEGDQFVASEGTAMLVIVPGTHRYRVNPEAGTWEFCYAVLYGRELLRVLQHAAREGPVISWDPGGHAETALFRLFFSFTSPKRASPYELSSRAYALGMALVSRQAQHPPGADDERIELTEEYVRRHLDGPLAVQDLATVAGMSRYHFSRVFASVTGLSPMRYVREARCERASTMLATTNLPIKTIAADVGFESTAYFCRVFRRLTSLTPSEYRRTRP